MIFLFNLSYGRLKLNIGESQVSSGVYILPENPPELSIPPDERDTFQNVSRFLQVDCARQGIVGWLILVISFYQY